MNILEWLEAWHLEQHECTNDGAYNITIQALDNPGWMIRIDLNDTSWEELSICETRYPEDYEAYMENQDDWYIYSFSNGIYEATGSSLRLEYLLQVFRDVVSNYPHPPTPK